MENHRRTIIFLCLSLLFFPFSIYASAQNIRDYTTLPEADSVEAKIEPLPILSYDSNTGFGFGAKSFFLNLLNMRESFDVIVFLSTKGERWFHFVYSMPDFDLRQGKYYPLAVDFIFDYDKWISYNFFGIGNDSDYDAKETYILKLTEINVGFSRGFTPSLVGRLSLKYDRVESGGFESGGSLEALPPSVNAPYLSFFSFNLNMTYDKRDSYLHPLKGMVAQADVQWARFDPDRHAEYFHWSLWYQFYQNLFSSTVVIAARFGLSSIEGGTIPQQLLIPLGGSQTLRGFDQGRFIDHTAALTNLELRFPIVGRLGGLLGLDAGRVWSSTKKLSFDGWHSDLVTGLRYFFDTYIVRVDVGFSKESLGIYFNFNHIF